MTELEEKRLNDAICRIEALEAKVRELESMVGCSRHPTDWIDSEPKESKYELDIEKESNNH